MRLLKFFGCFLLFVSCGAVVNYDYETTTDFSRYKTYNYFTDLDTGLSALDSKRLLRAIDAKLADMGLLLSNTPDFYIDIRSNVLQNPSRSNVGVGIGGSGRTIGGGVSVGFPLPAQQFIRELKIDFVANKRNKLLFWQAISESRFKQNASPEQRTSDFVKLVTKIFSHYPPQ